MSDYDAIIIGAGHNGLTCAAYLAQAGKRVVVIEARDSVGGLASHQHSLGAGNFAVADRLPAIPRKIVKDLALVRQGFCEADSPLSTFAIRADGALIQFAGGEATGVSEKDATAYREFHRRMKRYAGVLNPLWLQPPPRLVGPDLAAAKFFGGLGLRLRLLGADEMGEFLRVLALPMSDLLDEWFEDPQFKAMLCWQGLVGNKLAPHSPNHAVLNFLQRFITEDIDGMAVVGDGQHLIEALERATRAAGAEILTGAKVLQVDLGPGPDGLQATGVTLASGQRIAAGIVVSAAHPKNTFLDLVGQENLGIEFANRIRRIRSNGMVAKAHFMISAPLEIAGAPLADQHFLIAPSMDAIESAFDDVKYGGFPTDPMLEITAPRCPDQCHMISATVMYVPAQPKLAWDADAKERLLQTVVSKIARYSPNFQETVTSSELLTPQDIAETYGICGGHWHHGELALDQMMMMRPTYEAAQYRTPIAGLFLCSAGCHPGGGIAGAPGHNAAQEILK